MRTTVLLVLLSACLLPIGCTTSQRSADPGLWQRSELYFGMSRRGAADVTPEEWHAFLVSEVVPAFPDGFTELMAQGFFSEDHKSQQEPVRVLVILNPPEQSASANQKLNAIARSYCNRFNQRAVLRADSETRLTFLHGQ